MGIRLKDLSKLGYRDNVARSLVVDIVGKYCKHDTKEQIAMTLSNILEHPESYKNNEIWSKLAERLSPTVLAKEFVAYDLREDPLMYKTYGGKFIETPACNGRWSVDARCARRLWIAYRWGTGY